jgi:hypothetical protein
LSLPYFKCSVEDKAYLFQTIQKSKIAASTISVNFAAFSKKQKNMIVKVVATNFTHSRQRLRKQANLADIPRRNVFQQ